ncbi:MAG: ABC transporter ATP-binding protein [Rectinemataceae bacterium]|nr:ABC transporter ATP-binding protein [Rectinemataceae bacterium]
MDSVATHEHAPFLEMLGICKLYPENNVHANQDVDFSIREGEIHALVGENGAGKTSLMKILCGLEQPDKGTIRLSGKPVKIGSTKEAEKLGIGMVHQQFSLIDNFSIMDNIVLNREPVRCVFFYDKSEARREVQELSKKYRLYIDPDALVESLNVAEKQRVEILRILFRKSTILVLDEPTSLLTEQEVKVFFDILRQLASMRYTIVIITHKLEEVGRIADRVTVMRGGRIVGSCVEAAEIDTGSLSKMMVGKEVILQVEKPAQTPGDPILEVRGLTLRDPQRPLPLLKDVRLEVRGGEVLGIAAVAGNGLGELEDVLTGMCSHGKAEGEALLRGVNILCRSTAYLRSAGIAYVPADRLNRGSSLQLHLSDNLIVVDHHRFLKHGFFHRGSVKSFVHDLIARFGIQGRQKSLIGTLSGGNIQRAVLSRELSRETSLLIISEPTWGLDIGSSEFVYTEIMEIRGMGKAILLLSSNLDEILALSDRVAVMFKGEIVGLFDNLCLDRESLGDYMLGLKRQGAAARVPDAVGNSDAE